MSSWAPIGFPGSTSERLNPATAHHSQIYLSDPVSWISSAGNSEGQKWGSHACGTEMYAQSRV
jgi:hypothetical protein